MVKELTYQKNETVLRTWSTLQRLDNYHEVIGSSLYQKFFIKCPSAKALFGWPEDADPRSDAMMKSRAFKLQASLYVKLLDTVVDMLGPDLAMLEEILVELGEKHYKTYGVTHDMYEPMGEALMETFEEHLKDDFTPDVKSVWLAVWKDLSDDMTLKELQEMNVQQRRRNSAKIAAARSTVVESN